MRRKDTFLLLCVMAAAYMLVRYFPVRMEIASNAWEDDICPAVQCYFEMGDGFIEEDSINTEQRTISNKAYILKLNPSIYEKTTGIRVNFKRYSDKLFEDTKALEIEHIAFKKMGIPFFTIHEFGQEISYPVDAVWENGSLVIIGPYPSVVLLENIMRHLQHRIKIVNAALMLLFTIFTAFCMFLWKKYISKKICFARIAGEMKDCCLKGGQMFQPFLFMIFYFINYTFIKRIDIQGDFFYWSEVLLIAICVFLYYACKDKRNMILVILNYGVSMLLVTMQHDLKVEYYIPFIAIIVFSFGNMGMTQRGTVNCENSEKTTILDAIIVVVLMIGYFVLLYYRLEADPRMVMDEGYSLSVGTGILKTGKFVKWDFVNNCSMGEYSRAWIFYALTALFFKLFGTNVIVARAVSVMWGALFVPIVYCIMRKYFSRSQAVLTTIAICFNPVIMTAFRTARMYSMTLSISMLLIACCFNAVVVENQFKHENVLTRWIKENFDYHIKYLTITVVLLFAAYIVHMNTIILVAGFAAFVVLMAMITKEKKYMTVAKIIVVSVLLLIFVFTCNDHFDAFYDSVFSDIITGFASVITILSTPMESYFWSFLQVIGGTCLGIGATFITFLGFVLNRQGVKQSLRYKWIMYMLALETAVLFVFIFMANHYAAERYAIFILPVVIAVIVQGYLCLCRQYRSKIIRGVMTAMLLAFSLEGYAQQFVTMYQGHPRASNYAKEAQIVAEDAKSNEITLYASSFSPYDYQMFDKIHMIKYAFDEETNENSKNIEDFIQLALNNRNGYVTMEQRNLENFPFMKKLLEWFTQIGGNGYDNSNIDIYKYNFILNNTTPTTGIRFGEETSYEGITYRLGEMDEKKYLEVTVADKELLHTEFLAIKVRMENEKERYIEGYQLYTGDESRNKSFLIELNSRMENVQEYKVLNEIGICDLNYHVSKRVMSR